MSAADVSKAPRAPKAPQAPQPPKAAKAKKRKQSEDGGSRKRRKGASFVDDSLLDTEAGVNRAFETMDSQLLSDHLTQQTTRFGTDLSPIELSDLYISKISIKDTSSFPNTRNTENLPTFLEEFTEKPEDLGKAPKLKGAPHTIIVAGAGLRAADIVRAVRKYQTKDNVVAKLFAKHIKLEEAVNFLKVNRTGIAVGTPARLMDLLNNGALSVEHLRRLVVDASHIDMKKRGVLDMKDTMMPLARWLARKEFKDRYAAEEKPLELIFY